MPKGGFSCRLSPLLQYQLHEFHLELSMLKSELVRDSKNTKSRVARLAIYSLFFDELPAKGWFGLAEVREVTKRLTVPQACALYMIAEAADIIERSSEIKMDQLRAFRLELGQYM